MPAPLVVKIKIFALLAEGTYIPGIEEEVNRFLNSNGITAAKLISANYTYHPLNYGNGMIHTVIIIYS